MFASSPRRFEAARWIGATAFLLLFFSSIFVSQPPVDDPKLVHFGDIVDVDVVGSFEFDWRGGLTQDGFLDGLNTFGDPIQGLCRSELAIADDVAKALATTLRSPEVIVRIVDRSGRAVTNLDGAVRVPTRFRVLRPVRLQEMLILAGGVTDESSGEVSIFRPVSLACGQPAAAGEAEKPQILTFKISDLIAGKPEANPQVLSGDLVTVKRSLPVYVIGGVRNPRPIASREKLSLSRAVAIAGGVTKDSIDDITIFRRGSDGSKTIKASLKRIEAGEEKDVDMLPYDVVDVPQKGRERRTVPPAVLRSTPDSTVPVPLRIID